MFTVELYAGIRRAVMVDGLSRRKAAKRFVYHGSTSSKMLQFSVSLPSGLVSLVQMYQLAYRMENGGRGVAAHTYPCLARPHEAIWSLC